jgi:hypothetical protein
MKRYQVCNGYDETIFTTDNYEEAFEELDNFIDGDSFAYIWDSVMEEVIGDYFGVGEER